MLETTKKEHQPGYPHVEVSGGFELRAAKALYGDIRDECSKGGLSKVLIDAQSMEGEVPVIDRYGLGKHMAQVQRRGFEMAFVGAPEQATPDKFLDDAANHPAVTTLVTTDVDEAVCWRGREART